MNLLSRVGICVAIVAVILLAFSGVSITVSTFAGGYTTSAWIHLKGVGYVYATFIYVNSVSAPLARAKYVILNVSVEPPSCRALVIGVPSGMMWVAKRLAPVSMQVVNSTLLQKLASDVRNLTVCSGIGEAVCRLLAKRVASYTAIVAAAACASPPSTVSVNYSASVLASLVPRAPRPVLATAIAAGAAAAAIGLAIERRGLRTEAKDRFS